jgi:hypothetical protein
MNNEKVNPDNLIADDFGKCDPDTNRDAITGAPHSHPVGTGVGAAVGGAVGGIAAGAIIGAGVSGPAAPIGGVVGAVAAAIVGAAAGHAMAEHYEGSAHDLYWRENYQSRPYYEQGAPYETYGPAYQYGWEAYSMYQGGEFDEFEPTLGAGWERRRGSSSLSWERAKEAARDAWERMGSETKSAAIKTTPEVQPPPLPKQTRTSDDIVQTPDNPQVVRTPGFNETPIRDTDSPEIVRTNPDEAITSSSDAAKSNPDQDRTSRRIREMTENIDD